MKTIKQNPERMDRLPREKVHDPYATRLKLREPTVCPGCSAVFSNGRWQWMESWPEGSHQELCPACHRIRDNYPAGEVTIAGTLTRKHKSELLDLVRHQEEAEKTQHPLHRLMGIEEKPESIVITTTDVHLPKRIANALQHAYKGSLQIHYADEEYFVRIHWTHQT
jgi:hypothetical protein